MKAVVFDKVQSLRSERQLLCIFDFRFVGFRTITCNNLFVAASFQKESAEENSGFLWLEQRKPRQRNSKRRQGGEIVCNYGKVCP